MSSYLPIGDECQKCSKMRSIQTKPGQEITVEPNDGSDKFWRLSEERRPRERRERVRFDQDKDIHFYRLKSNRVRIDFPMFRESHKGKSSVFWNRFGLLGWNHAWSLYFVADKLR